MTEFDGSDPSKPIYLASRGVIFDVTSGAAFYGKDGAYPFGGKECARALAKFSTELSGEFFSFFLRKKSFFFGFDAFPYQF